MRRRDQNLTFVEDAYPLIFPYSRGMGKLSHLEALNRMRATLDNMCDERMLSTLTVLAVAMKLRANRDDTAADLCDRIKNRLTAADVRLRDENNWRYIDQLDSRVFEKSRDGDLQGVIALIKQGANADTLDSLPTASHRGYLEIVKYLLRNTLDEKKINQALVMAASVGHLEIVKYLVENGADIHTGDNYPLTMAEINGHSHVVKYLMEHGAQKRSY